MKKFKLLGLLILVFGIFAAQGATAENGADAAEVEVLVRAARKDREDLIKELLTEEQMAQLAAKHQLKKDQTLIVYSDGVTAEVFNNNELQNLHVLKSVANLVENKFPGTVIELGIHFRKDSSLNALFDFVVELSNVTAEKIDALRATLSKYSFTDLLIIAEMLDVLMLDNDDFNIEQFVADVLLQKFRELSDEIQANFDLSLVPRNVVDKKFYKFLNNSIFENSSKIIFSLRNSLAASIKRDFSCEFIDLRTLTLLKIISQNIENVVFSPDGSRVAVIKNYKENNTLEWLDGFTLELTRIGSENVANVVFSPDGSRVAIIKNALDNCECEFLDVHTLESTGRVFQNVANVVFSPDGSKVAIRKSEIGNCECEFLDVHTLESTGRAFQNVANVVFSPDGSKVAIIKTEVDNWECEFLDIRTLERVGRAFQNVANVIFSPDGRMIAVKKNYMQRWECEFLNIRTLERIGRVFQNTKEIVFSPNGNIVVIVKDINENHECEFLNTHTLQPLKQMLTNVRTVEFSPDDQFLIIFPNCDQLQFYEKRVLLEGLNELQDGARLLQEARLRKDAEEKALAQLIKEARDRENRALEVLQELMQEAQLREQLAKEEEARLINEARLRKEAEERALKTEKRD